MSIRADSMGRSHVRVSMHGARAACVRALAMMMMMMLMKAVEVVVVVKRCYWRFSWHW